jgi:alpha-ketoglutarate-dependent 2,4-dichlorophenoxyacetate dioxygenase
MNISFSQLHPHFVAEVHGVDLREANDRETLEKIRAGMDQYGVLVFRNQPFTNDEQLAFAQRFDGKLHAKTSVSVLGKNRFGNEALTDISNVADSGEILAANDRRRVSTLSNRLWHTDASFENPAGRYSMLSARVVPPVSADTEFADMRAAYDGLDAETRALVDPLHAEHSLLHSRGKLGFTEFTPEEIERFAPVAQALVNVHPVTRRKSLFLSAHIGKIVDLPLCDGLVLLANLTEHATQKEYRYRHPWRPFDLIMWDNRTTMHRGHRYDERQKRDLRRFTTVA